MAAVHFSRYPVVQNFFLKIFFLASCLLPVYIYIYIYACARGKICDANKQRGFNSIYSGFTKPLNCFHWVESAHIMHISSMHGFWSVVGVPNPLNLLPCYQRRRRRRIDERGVEYFIKIQKKKKKRRGREKGRGEKRNNNKEKIGAKDI